MWSLELATLETEDQEYGAWIHAPPTPFFKKSIIMVSGFYGSRKKGGLSTITPRSQKRGGVAKVNLENSSPEVQTEDKEIVDFRANIMKIYFQMIQIFWIQIPFQLEKPRDSWRFAK